VRYVWILVRWLLVMAVIVGGAATAWLYLAPPATILVATGYSAKTACSNVFVAGRTAQEVLEVDLQAQDHPVFDYITVEVDEQAGAVNAALLGIFGERRAIRREGAGCTLLPFRGGEPSALPAIAGGGDASTSAYWPIGERVVLSEDPALAAILDDETMTGPGMRAIVVAHKGRIVAERYGDGISQNTPLIGWSMTKTVTAAIIGTLRGDERLSLDQDGLFEAWSVDDRSAITIADMLSMSSGLAFNEDYGDVTDVTRMLYVEDDMAGFAADNPLTGTRGETFSYSSGTTVMLSRLWQDAFDDAGAALEWPRQALFDPLRMKSAVLETDAQGTFVGSSYLWATARDWARFGELLRNDGTFAGEQVLPEGFVRWMREPAPASDGEYGRGHLWLHGPTAGTPDGEDPDAGFDLPDDAFWLLGYDGQSTVVIPSRDLVVVRLGLTPTRLGYKPQGMVEALARHFNEPR
jgi:CubicO group peptidase (beta-lactamase class C family)